MEEVDINNLFKAFDYNEDGTVDFDEFLRIVVGPMNRFRENLINKVFDKLDRTEDGVVDIDDIRGIYDGSRHPDVKNGKKTEDEVLKDFLETFEMHHNVQNGYQADGTITREEFVEYYNNISSNIENDAYFDLMVTNAWNLDNKNNAASMPYAGSSMKVTNINSREAWRQDHHRTLFGNKDSGPIPLKGGSEWTTTSKGMVYYPPSNAVAAGNSSSFAYNTGPQGQQEELIITKQ